MFKRILQTFVGGGLGVLFSTLPSEYGEKPFDSLYASCARWSFFDGSRRFAYKHTYKAVDRNALLAIDGYRWRGQEWNRRLKIEMDCVLENEECRGTPVVYGSEKRMSIIMQTFGNFLTQYREQDPRTNTIVRCGLKRTPYLGPCQETMSNDVGYSSQLCTIMCAFYQPSLGRYDVYLAYNQHVLIGHDGGALPRLIEPVHYEANLAQDTQGREKVTRDLINKSKAEQQARFVYDNHLSRWFFSTSKCVVPYIVAETSLAGQRPLNFLTLEELNIVPNINHGKAIHDFTYQYTCQAIGFPQQFRHEHVTSRTYEDWQAAAINLLGHDVYGLKKVHHIILNNVKNIMKDLERSSNKPLSEDHFNWVWLEKRQSIVTMIWDTDMDCYRFYLYKGYVLLECKEKVERSNNFIIPVKIVFIDESYRSPPYAMTIQSLINLPECHPYVKYIIEKWQEIMLKVSRDYKYIQY